METKVESSGELSRQEVIKVAKKGIPVHIVPFVPDGSSTTTLRPSLESFKGILVIDDGSNENEENPKMKRRKWLKEMRGWLMVLATLAASVTYQAGLNPPGGFWGSDNQALGYVAGNPVLRDKIFKRYETFYYFNATAFITSLVIIILLMNESFYHKEGKILTLEFTIVLDLISLMGAYVAGSTRNVSSSIYLIVLTCAVFLYVVYIAQVLPNVCFHVLLALKPLEFAAEKGWLPVTDKIMKRVKDAREERTTAPRVKRCCFCCQPRNKHEQGAMQLQAQA